MILDVAAQFIEMVESEEERQTHLDIACAAWNLSILPKNKREKEYKKGGGRLAPPTTICRGETIESRYNAAIQAGCWT